MGRAKIDREAVWNKYHGRCAYCGCELPFKEMQVDHIQPQCVPQDDPNRFSNLNPSCRICNHYKRSLSLEGFRERLKTLHMRVERQYITRVAIQYGIVDLEPFDGRFYYEKVGDAMWVLKFGSLQEYERAKRMLKSGRAVKTKRRKRRK